MTLKRKLSLIGVTALAASAAAMATAQDTKPEAKEKHRIVVMERADGKAPAGAVREFRIKRGADGKIELPERCQQGNAAADLDEKDGNKRSRILIGTKTAGSPAEQLEF